MPEYATNHLRIASRPDLAGRFRRLLNVVGAFAFAFVAMGSLGEGAPSNHRPADLLPLFEQHCFDCHGDGMRKGSFDLEALLQGGENDTNRLQWVKVWTIVRHGFMPPADADPLPEPGRREMTQWIEQRQLGVNYDQPDPGRVTIRRLNRMEYEFTVQDLFGVNLEAEGEFSSDVSTSRSRLRDLLPPDDTAFGFDNNGDFQTLSPALLEKYFNIAEYVVDQVVVQDGPRYPTRALDVAQLKTVRAPETNRTEQTLEFEIAHPGDYRLEVRFSLGGWQEYGGAYDFSLKVDDQPLAEDVLEVGGQRIYKYTREIAFTNGIGRVTLATVATKPNSTGKLAPLELRPKFRLTGPIRAEFEEYPEAHRRIFFQGPAPFAPGARREYARQIMKRVADRAFRRPVAEDLLERLTDLVLRSENFESGVGNGLLAILTSPQFIFRSEVQPRPDDPKSAHPLDEYALASRLSYFLWLSLPDDELADLASRGELRKRLPQQLQRMLADPRSERFFEDFPGQWLRTRNVLMTPIARDAQLNPVRGSMKRETEMLFEHIVREDRDLIELVTADYTFADRKLAEFYGLTGLSGEGFQRVALPPDTHRGGVLTHGSFLVATSNPNRTSPVKRGVFVLENLLAIHPPPPPPSVPALEDAKKAAAEAPKTGSELLALHRADKACAACHAHFDPIGIALENFDALGRWRAQEGGEPIAPKEKTVTGQTLSGIDDLKQFFVERKLQFYRCVTEKLLTYALGRGMDPSDAVTVDRIADEVAAHQGKFSTLLLAVVNSPAFQTRRGDDGLVKTPPRLLIPEAPPPEERKGRRRRPANPEQTQAQPPAREAAAPAVVAPLVTP